VSTRSEAPENSGGSAARRVPVGRRFPAGRSGNPGGRPRSLTQIQQLARSYAPAAITGLVDLMRSSSPRLRLEACKALLDRGYGKPPFAVAVAQLPRRQVPNFGMTFPDGGPGQEPDVDVSPAQIGQEEGATRLLERETEMEVSGPEQECNR